MNILLWVLQVLAALLYGASGIMKVFMFDEISEQVPSFGALPREVWMALGILELVCTVGLIVPAALRWQPPLTVLAATLLATESLVFVWVHVKYGEITPMFERDRQTAAIYTNSYNPSPAPPCNYFLMPGAFLILCLSPVPNNSWPITIDYWSVPQLVDSLQEQIPLVPAFMHHVLLKRLEAQIFRYTLGEGAAKYQAAMGEYAALVAKYSAMDGMAPGEHIDYMTEDDYGDTFDNAAPAVQSTK